MQLSSAQVAEFREKGYLLVDQFLPRATVERYRAAYMETVDRLRSEGSLRNGAAADDSDAHEKVFQLRTAHLLHEAFDEHIRSEAFLDVVQSLIGANIQLVHYQGLFKPPYTGGAVNWHQDDFYWPSRDSTEGSVSLWVPLDDATVENGCMWYVPGSHRTILEHEQLWDPKQRKGFYYGIASLPAELERRAVPAEVRAGGIAIHAGALVHCSRPNHSPMPRRALASHFINPRVREPGGVFAGVAAEAIPILRSTPPSSAAARA
ncbi:MAG: phytanoyl-CoA dioxygenase family protein [Hyphomicrobiaceae bacterium]|nr:phytanoyl-CoA dioxygenase family protein [Hyphomicrobiaceae bacterium]